MQQIVDPYRALGVGRSATEVEIKAAHRKLVKRYHPDTGSQSDTERFLRVQEAYRVLSDPLARREWDLKHAPGPVRADRSAGTTTRRRRQPAPKPASEPAETPPPPRERAEPADPRTQPRSSRAYTWSASEVPWWEEAGTRTEKRPPRRRATGADAGAASADNAGAPPEQATGEETSPKADAPVFNQQDFDVYNRSSGAAWSMAARAYFRKGDADLPKRGSFHHEGTQVVTAGRARKAAQDEARRRAAGASAQAAAEADAAAQAAAQADAAAHAAARADAAVHAEAMRAAETPARPAYAYSSSASSPSPAMGTTHIVRRSLASPWPTLGNRFAYALIAWLPLASVLLLASVEMIDQVVPFALIVTTLVALLAFPRVAYVAAVATVLALLVGGLFVGGLALTGRLPEPSNIAVFIGGLLAVAYVATAVVAVVGPKTLRPWSRP